MRPRPLKEKRELIWWSIALWKWSVSSFFVYADALFDMWRCISCLYFILNVCYSHTKETNRNYIYIIKTTLEIIFEEYLLFACFWMDRIRRDHVASVKHPIRFGFDGLYICVCWENIYFFYRLPKAKHLIFFCKVHLLRGQKMPKLENISVVYRI